MTSIEIVRRSGLKSGDSTDGILRSRAFESENVIFSQSCIGARSYPVGIITEPGNCTDPLVEGTLQLEYSGTRTKIVELKTGDFFHIPVSLVHRDLNTDRDQEAVVVNFLVGDGPAVINLSPSMVS